MPVASVALKTMSLPEFGEPTLMPLVARNAYEARIGALVARGFTRMRTSFGLIACTGQ